MSKDIHVYVCMHMARDCQCGNMGSAVVQTFCKELGRRRERDAWDPSMHVKLVESAHVGGHKWVLVVLITSSFLISLSFRYAANVLVYPHGEWFVLSFTLWASCIWYMITRLGLVKPEDVSNILNTILSIPACPVNPNEKPVCPSHWRASGNWGGNDIPWYTLQSYIRMML